MIDFHFSFQEVSDLIKCWSEHLRSCDRIFLRAPSFNRAMFFNGKTPPLDKRDPRIRLIPFPTRRPTFSEVKRVHEILATVECYGRTQIFLTRFHYIIYRIGVPKLAATFHRLAKGILRFCRSHEYFS